MVANTALDLDELRRRVRADLELTHSSPHLIRAEVWQAQGVQLGTCADWLLPDSLPTLEQLVGFRARLRLGHHFERLHALIIGAQANLSVLALNRVLLQGGRTVGEIDCLYRTSDGEVVHREVAVKLFLSHRDSPASKDWIGTGKVDRLDLKLDRLLQHQTRMSTLPHMQEAWPTDLPRPSRVEVFMLGAFFKHLSHKAWPEVMHEQAQTGFWCTSKEFESLALGAWSVLHKPWWLTTSHVHREPKLDVINLAQSVEAQQTPVLVTCCETIDQTLPRRGFVVPVGWADE